MLPLGAGRGFVYLDRGTVGILSPSGEATALASGATAIAMSRDGTQIAYTVATATRTEIWGLAVELRSRFLLQAEAGAVDGLTWSPDGSRLAYHLLTATGGSIRVRTVSAAGAVTVATGGVSDPAWDADSAHLFVLDRRGVPAVGRIYRISASAGVQTLAGGGMPANPNLQPGAPQPSADGHQVAFLGTTGTNPLEVWLMNADGTGLVRLTGGRDYSYSCLNPRWTPPACTPPGHQETLRVSLALVRISMNDTRNAISTTNAAPRPPVRRLPNG